MADRCLKVRSDKNLLLSNKMVQEIVTAINRALMHQKAPAHGRIMNAKRNAKGMIIAIMHQTTTAEMALQYHHIMITAARMVDQEVVDVDENESWDRLPIHAVALIRYMEG